MHKHILTGFGLFIHELLDARQSPLLETLAKFYEAEFEETITDLVESCTNETTYISQDDYLEQIRDFREIAEAHKNDPAYDNIHRLLQVMESIYG